MATETSHTGLDFHEAKFIFVSLKLNNQVNVVCDNSNQFHTGMRWFNSIHFVLNNHDNDRLISSMHVSYSVKICMYIAYLSGSKITATGK